MTLYFKYCTELHDEILDIVNPARDIPIVWNSSALYSIEIGNLESLTATDDIVSKDKIFLLYSTEDLERFKRILNEEELARFNAGKPQFSLIDFSLWYIQSEVTKQLVATTNVSKNLMRCTNYREKLIDILYLNKRLRVTKGLLHQSMI